LRVQRKIVYSIFKFSFLVDALLHVASLDLRTNKLDKDLTKASVAKDCTISIVDKNEPNIEKADLEHMRKLITDL
jgi:hypothetical protein